MSALPKQAVAAGFNDVAVSDTDTTPEAKPKTTTMSFRVYKDERDEIRALAGSQTVGEYLREQALQRRSRRKRRVRPVTSTQENAARMLGLLGQTGVFDSLSRIADAAESGALPVTDELTDELRNACALIIAIRHDLIEALGIKARE